MVENNQYEEGSNSDYNKIYAIDEVCLFRFLYDTQDEKFAEHRNIHIQPIEFMPRYRMEN